MFLAVSLPAPALLHIGMFSLYNMLIRLEDSPLVRLARHCLSVTPPPPKSWFTSLDILCHQYQLMIALSLLNSPPPKNVLKNLVKKKVLNFWEIKLREESQCLSSLAYFKPSFYSLSTTHPLWTTVGSSPYETKKAVVQARMLSGRYRTEKLRRHWSTNKEGVCLLPTCNGQIEDLPHVLVGCPALQEARDRVQLMWVNKLSDKPHILNVVKHYVDKPDSDCIQFLIDPSVLPLVINLKQEYGIVVFDTIFNLTRTYCYSLHIARLKLLGLL